MFLIQSPTAVLQYLASFVLYLNSALQRNTFRWREGRTKDFEFAKLLKAFRIPCVKSTQPLGSFRDRELSHMKWIKNAGLITIHPRCWSELVQEENKVYLFVNHHIFIPPPMRFFLSTPPSIPSSRRSAHSVFAAKRAHSATNKILRKPGPSVWVFPEIYQIARWKIKHSSTFLSHKASISRTLTTLIGWSAMTLPDSSFSLAFQSMRAEKQELW